MTFLHHLWSSLILLFPQTSSAKHRSSGLSIYVNDFSRVSIPLSRTLKGKSPSPHCTLFLPQRYENSSVAANKIIAKGLKSFPLYSQPPHAVSSLEEPLLVLHLCVRVSVQVLYICVCKSFTLIIEMMLYKK